MKVTKGPRKDRSGRNKSKLKEISRRDKQMDVKTSVEAEHRRKTWEHVSTTG